MTVPGADPIERHPIIGVMGSHDETHRDRAREVGDWIGRQGYHLLTGGGGGVMGAVTAAFVSVPQRRGVALAIVPAVTGDPQCRPLPGYPNQSVEIPIYTHLDPGVAGDESTSRNHINVLTSTVVIVLPGGNGTASEARLAVRYGKPCVAYLRSHDELPGCPPEIEVAPDLARVTAYVEAQLERARPVSEAVVARPRV